MKNKTFPITTIHQISLENISSILVCAFEGGSNYWYGDLEPLKQTSKKKVACERFYEDLVTNGFRLLDKDEDKIHEVRPAQLIEAAQRMAEDQPTHFNDWITESDDAITGDVFLQLAVFGKVIHG